MRTFRFLEGTSRELKDEVVMSDQVETLRSKLASAHAEALRVGDSPIRADRVASQIQAISREVGSAGLDEDRVVRVEAFLENALRVLRRDDDGREAAKHLDSALALFGPAPSRPSPFLDP